MKKALKEILSMSLYLLVVLCAVYLLIHYVGQRTQVQGSSMEPMLSNGDNLIVDKISYRFRDPERYDIIVFPFQYEDNTFYIKRIIGLPGETVTIRDGKVYINDSTEPLRDDFCPETPVGDFGPYEVPEGCYFMLGDNRNVSKDSRYWLNPYVEKDKIIGKAFLRYWPLNKISLIE